MRRARLTWRGAFHHIMNRGINGSEIFFNDKLKKKFLDLLKINIKKYRIRLFAYCILDNHYHLVLENSSGRLSDFMKNLNGSYGHYYRKKMNSHGYVFQNRYKSTLIENDQYLIQCIGYVLQNPTRASLGQTVTQYIWSSMNEYYSKSSSIWIDKTFVENLFGNRENLMSIVEKNSDYGIAVKNTSWGGILGGVDFLNKAVSRYDRRKGKESSERRRFNDLSYEPTEKVFQEFEKKHGREVDTIDTSCLNGKRLRGELLVKLKDLSGLKYHEIARFNLFSDLQPNSLRSIYRNFRQKKQ